MPYKHIFFDLDDTLWDFHANARNSLHVAFDRLGLVRFFPGFDDFFRIYMKRNNELWDLYGEGQITKDFLQAERFLHPLRQADVPQANTLANSLQQAYMELLPTRTLLVPHAREVLDYLHGRYTLSIVSNGFVEVQYRKIRNSGIAGYFDHIVLSEEAGALKPDKRIFEHALRLNAARPDETLMVGDLYQADIAGAQNASIDQAYFNWRGTPLPPANAPTYTIRSLRELMEIL